MKKIRNSLKKVLPILLAVSLLMTSMFIATSAESTTAVTTAPNTQICSINSFTQDNFNTFFKPWLGKNPAKTIEDGVLKLKSNQSNTGSTRDVAYMVQTPTWNQYVSMTVKQDNAQAITPVLWLRTYEFDRGGASDNIVPLGYCVKAGFTASNYVTVRVRKSYLNDSDAFVGENNIDLALIENIPMVTQSGAVMGLKLEAMATYDAVAQTNVIKVNIYRVDAEGKATLWDVLCAEDNESELLHEGWAGFAVSGASTDPLKITSFAYHSTDDNLEKVLYSTSSFDDYMDNTTAWSNNKYSSVEDGKLVIAASGNGTDRDSARFLNKAGENLKVSATVKTPHYFDGDTPVRFVNNAVLWIKAVSFMRDGKTPTPAGYFIRTTYNASNNNIQIRLYKQTHINNALQGASVLSDPNPINIDAQSSGKNVFCDISYDATVTYNPDTNANDIEVKVYKNTGLMKTITVSDSDQNLMGPGTPGLGGNNSGATFTSFKASVADASTLAPAYVEVNGVRNDTMLAQAVKVDKSASYRFSAVANGDFTDSPLCIAYQGSDSKVAYLELTPTAADAIDAHYNRYSYDVDFSTLGLTNALIYAGVKMQSTGSAANHLKFSEFEFRKLNGGVAGGNLLFNGDFRMGTCGWTAGAQDMLNKAIQKFTPHVADSTELLYNRFKYYRDTDAINYKRAFINAEYMGDVNEDSVINIKDLVRIKKNWSNEVYAIFGDFDNDNKLDATDVSNAKQVILEQSKKA